MGKIWKRPTSFWTMPFKWGCNKSAYDGLFCCGYQRCKHKGFETPRSYKQHLWWKKNSDGHPTLAQPDAYEEEPYVPPKGYRPYGLWDPETNEVATTSMSANEITEEMFQQQKERMLASVKGTPKKRKEPTSEDEEGSAESVRSSSPMALRVYLEDEGEEEEDQVEDAPIEDEEEDLEKLRKMKAQSERPARSESDKPALEEKKEDKKFPLETTSKAMAKPKPKSRRQVASPMVGTPSWLSS